MPTVWNIDGETRIILPGSEWGNKVLATLKGLGHVVEKVDQDPHLCVRDDAEMERMHALLDETKL